MSLTNIDELLTGIEPQIETKIEVPRETINNESHEELTTEPVIAEPGSTPRIIID